MKVLLADDSDLILERLKESLCLVEKAEIVATLKNGNDTLEALRVLKPEIAIVDIEMPGLSGLEILTEIRKENKSIIFIILTFHSSEYFRKLADKAGADFFFNKSDDFQKVSTTVADIIRNEISYVNNNKVST